MVKFSFKFWLLSFWVAGTWIFLNVAAENPDISLTIASVVNLILCASVIKARKDIINEALKDLPEDI